MIFLEFFSIYLFGAIGYGSLEILYRGYTHWSMLLTGGLCCCLIHLIATRMSQRLWEKWIMCAAVITTVEFLVGCIVNIRLGWHVWDYSGMRLNLMGQICPAFTGLWLLLSVPCVSVSRFLKDYVFIDHKAA